MKKSKEFYVIISKDGKFFTGSSYCPHKLNSDQILKVKGFKTKEGAEEVCNMLPNIYRKDIENDLDGIKWSREHGFSTDGWEDQLKLDQRKLKAVEGASIKKVSLSLEIEE